MEAYRTEIRVIKTGVLQLENLPFKEGDWVEVIILGWEKKMDQSSASPLKGRVIQYIDPTEPVAQEDWEIFQ